MQSIVRRTSVRKFSDQKIEEQVVKNIVKAGMSAPSAHNFQPWEFLIVTDQKDSEAISKMSPHAKPAENSPLNIVLLANMNAVEKEDLWWQQDMSACAENILLQAVEEGLGGTWLGFYPEEERCNKLKVYFELPEYIIPFAVITVGIPEKEVEPKNKENWSKVHWNKY